MPKRRRDDDPDQSRRFIETARELGCDEDEAAFEEQLKRIATVKPKPRNRSANSKPKPPKETKRR